jgi:hypothetical protein
MRFYGEEFLTPSSSPKLEYHPLSAVSDCLFNIFIATFHIGGRPSIHSLRKRHALVRLLHLSRLPNNIREGKSGTTWRHRVWESGQNTQRIFIWQTWREILPGKPVLRRKDILEIIRHSRCGSRQVSMTVESTSCSSEGRGLCLGLSD